MGWTQHSRDDGQYAVYSQDLVCKEVGSPISGENWTDIIDFIPPGKDFTVIANVNATNLSASTHVELWYGWDPAATAVSGRTQSDVTPFKPVTAEIDTATVELKRDVSGFTEYPYYWLKMSGGGNVTVKILITDPA